MNHMEQELREILEYEWYHAPTNDTWDDFHRRVAEAILKAGYRKVKDGLEIQAPGVTRRPC